MLKFGKRAVASRFAGGNGGVIVAYLNASLVIDRLNLVVPSLWWDEYEPLGQNHLICKLTVGDITRQDVGEGKGKALYSDALKRAAVKFGIGVSLRAIPQIRLKLPDAAKHLEKGANGKGLYLTEHGEAKLREGYGKWLTEHGAQLFGAALDHGDVAGAQGDVDEDEAVSDDQLEFDPQPLETEEAEFARAKVKKLAEELFDRQVLTKTGLNEVNVRLRAAEHDQGDLDALVADLEGRLVAA